MKKTIQFIPYNDLYKSEVISLILKIQTQEFGFPISLKDQPDLENIPKVYQVNSGNFWVAVADKKVIGTIALLDIGNNQTALRKMFVDNSYRGKDVAKSLLTVLFNWCKQKMVTQIFLGTTSAFLAAHRFYEKNDFIEISKSALPSSFPIMEVDSKFYVYQVE